MTARGRWLAHRVAFETYARRVFLALWVVVVEVFLYFLAGFNAILVWHLYVQHNHVVVVWWEIANHFDSPAAIHGCVHYIKMLLQSVLKGVEKESVVVCKQALRLGL